MTRVIGPALSDEERAAFIAAARSFLTSNGGQPAAFRHQGRRPVAMDCIGLLVLSIQAIGRAVNNRIDYGKTPNMAKLHASMAEHFGPAVEDEPRPGDVVTMRWTKEECHVGVIVDHPERGIGLVHCYRSSEKVIEHGLDHAWRRRIVAVFRP